MKTSGHTGIDSVAVSPQMGGSQMGGQSVLAEFRVEISQNKMVLQRREGMQISRAGLWALNAIGGSTALSPAQKRTLARLVAIVDEFAGGSPRLMRQIVGVAKLMAMQSTRSYKPTTLEEMLRMYREERERLTGRSMQPDEVEVEIAQVRISLELRAGLTATTEDATGQWA